MSEIDASLVAEVAIKLSKFAGHGWYNEWIGGAPRRSSFECKFCGAGDEGHCDAPHKVKHHRSKRWRNRDGIPNCPVPEMERALGIEQPSELEDE